MSDPTEFIYSTPLWKVRRLGDGWYQGETVLYPAPTTRTQNHREAMMWITNQVRQFLAEQGYWELPTVCRLCSESMPGPYRGHSHEDKDDPYRHDAEPQSPKMPA